MNNTEENIVYQLLNSIRAGELNSDEVIDEREIRAFMRSHRAELIAQYSLEGKIIQDICFQVLPSIGLTQHISNIYKSVFPIPQIVQLPNHFGIRLTTLEYITIALTEDESFHLAQTDPLNKYQPIATIENEILYIYTGAISPQVLTTGDGIGAVISSIKRKKVRISAVLDNTDDGLNYNWTTSQYPLPAELIQTMKKNILRREFNIILSTKSDQVPNAKNDTLRYHDQGKVQN